MSKKKSRVIFSFLPLAIITTGLSFLIFVVSQQQLRLGTNDLLVQLAHDASSQVEKTVLPPKLSPYKVEISKNLSTYVMFFDKNKKLIATTALLDGQAPVFPEGVLESAKKNVDSRITWQPKAGVRQATVTVYFKNQNEGYVVAGRSLSEVEKRIELLQLQVFVGYIITIFFTFLANILFFKVQLR